MYNLFAYGTLMCDDIMAEVSGCCLSFVAGTLKGYSRRSVKGEYFPGLGPDASGIVDGIVYRDVPDSAWVRLDRFEGEMYVRRDVRIELSNGIVLPAATYVVHPEYLDHLEASDWDFETFLRNDKTRFQKGYRGYRKL
jgi:gamma-glutamylcyclotransferase (GGCT)/AIG2-like uncharacterized protein YtfP